MDKRPHLSVVPKGKPTISFSTAAAVRTRFPGVRCSCKVDSSTYVEISTVASEAELIAADLATEQQFRCIPRCGSKCFSASHPLARGVRLHFKRKADGRWLFSMLAYLDGDSEYCAEVLGIFGIDIQAEKRRENRDHLVQQLRSAAFELRRAREALDQEHEGYRFADSDKNRLKFVFDRVAQEVTRAITGVECVSVARAALHVVGVPNA